jgi:segregation and condensation protein B
LSEIDENGIDNNGVDDNTGAAESTGIAETPDIGESAGDGQDEGAEENPADEHRIFEALLFASDELLTPAKLKALIPGAPDARRLRKMAAAVNEQLRREGHPFEIVEAAGGYQFRTAAFYHTWVRKLYKERAAKKLSLQALECLAIIAYRQPISKAEVEAVRGVLSDGAMKTLLEKKLVDICGRSDKPGRPLLYGTTNDFLRYFGINKVSDLPRIEEFEALARAKMEELSAGELEEQKSREEHDRQDAVETAPEQSVSEGDVPAGE